MSYQPMGRPVPPPPSREEIIIRLGVNYGAAMADLKSRRDVLRYTAAASEKIEQTPKKKDPRTFIGWSLKAFIN